MTNDFIKYHHIERLGKPLTEDLLNGEVWVFYKLDGTNASVWRDGSSLAFGSRKRRLTLVNDNQGFMAMNQDNDALRKWFNFYPHLRLYGEWLVPHTIKGYREDAWNKFYVFDVLNEDTGKFIRFDDYKNLLEAHGLDYVPPIARFNNPTQDDIIKTLDKTGDFLVQEGKLGEGVVIKNYELHEQIWGKVVRTEFKENHRPVRNTPVSAILATHECEFLNEYQTDAFMAKEQAKLINEKGTAWKDSYIGEFLKHIATTLIREETANYVLENKYPTLDFKQLYNLSVRKTKGWLGI